MKKLFIIILFVITINISGVNPQVLNYSAKHLIEYRIESKRKSITKDEVLSKEVSIYLKLELLKCNVRKVNMKNCEFFNTS